MTYLLPLLFKAYIISTASMQAKMSSSQITLKMSKFYPFIDFSSVPIFLTLSKFTNKGIIAKTPSLTTFTPFSISVCLLFFTYYIKINYSFINCFLYTFSFKLCLTKTMSNVNCIKYAKQCGILYHIATLFLFLVVVSNMSLLNPGPERPEGLSCFFHNVQGFVTPNSISKPSPDLNITKVMEFQAYIFEKAPDIILLNETWLKPSINSNEIIPGKSYKIFRKDRSPLSHPPDPNTPGKFKLNGGGVLIAVKNCLNLHPKEIKCTTQAEILSVELSLPGRKKFSISTLYRVGTLGRANLMEVEKHLFEIFRSRKYKHNFIVGDLNLESVDWHRNTASNNTHTQYINLLCDLGLSQLILHPTHRSGNTLDILLSDSSHLVQNLEVMPIGAHINLDHSPLKFLIHTHIKRNKISKRTIYNYKRANYTALNNDLNRNDWNYLLDSTEVGLGWSIFKTKLTTLCDKHIPKITVKETFKPPWFDSEVFRLNKKKEHFRQIFKRYNNPQDYNKFSSLRKELKCLIKTKMRSNFEDDISPNTITKKFWSYVKASSKSSRIPDKMYLNSTVRNNPTEVANLFNQHF